MDAAKKAIDAINRIPRTMVTFARNVLAKEAVLMTSHIKSVWLRGGTTAQSLKVRSGHLIQNTRALPVTDTGAGNLESGTGFYNTRYARAHIGPRGQVTTIKPVRKKWLTIPFKAALVNGREGGQSRGGALSGRYGETFFRRTMGADGRERLILYGKLKSTRGPSAGAVQGEIVPLFLLVKQVKIKSRVFPEEILKWEMPRMIKAFMRIGIELKER
jgi:hypothetical protein